MFEQILAAPPDPILGLNEAFLGDSRPEKINLTVGVYKDDHGKTPALDCVLQAESAILAALNPKAYLPIPGLPAFCEEVPQLVLGERHSAMAGGRVATVQTPGGTAALRLSGDFFKRLFPESRVWLPEPTWPNHPKIFGAAGVDVTSYPYCDASGRQLDAERMFEAVAKIPAGDVLLLHGCCHNPTGVDLSPDHWRTMGQLAQERGFLVLVDFAYQGFADGLEEDAAGVRQLCDEVGELLICSSFSKNFGLYNERVGALTVVTKTPESGKHLLSHLKLCVRTNYSNPPRHGAAIVAHVLQDAELRSGWEQEVAAMRQRIKGLRRGFVDTMNDLKSPVPFDFINEQRGMFSFSGLTSDQVDRLREKHAIYMVRNGRINVAGMSHDQLPRICQSILDVL